MRAVVVRCPNCNANLEVASTVTSTTCSYCGTVARIQARTAMFQIPKKPPPQQMHQLQNLPVAVQRVSVAAILIPMFLVLGLVGAGIFFAMRGIRHGVSNFANTIATRTMWAGHAPALVDVDGDGVPDPIGVLRYISDGDRAVFVAHSGKTGARLWESPPLGKYSQLGQITVVGTSAMFLVANSDGTLVGRDKANGAVKWTVPLGEKVSEMCAGPNGGVVVVTADDKWWEVDVAGTKREGKKLVRLDRIRTENNARAMFDAALDGGVCIPLGARHNQPHGMLALESWRDIAKVPGMRVQHLVKSPKGGPAIAVGVKSPGTAVPMLARLEGQKATWQVELPAVDPLDTRFDPKLLAMNDKAIFALYSSSKNTKDVMLTAFDLATGKRLWNQRIESGSGFVAESLVVTGDVILLSTWQHLTAYSQADGSGRYRIGEN